MHTHVQAGAVGVGMGVRHTRAHTGAGRGRGGQHGRGRHGHAAFLDSVMCGSSCGTLNKNCYPFRILKTASLEMLGRNINLIQKSSSNK